VTRLPKTRALLVFGRRLLANAPVKPYRIIISLFEAGQFVAYTETMINNVPGDLSLEYRLSIPATRLKAEHSPLYPKRGSISDCVFWEILDLAGQCICQSNSGGTRRPARNPTIHDVTLVTTCRN
jgi:hypothetical protein